MLEKTFKMIKSNYQPDLLNPITKPYPLVLPLHISYMPSGVGTPSRSGTAHPSAAPPLGPQVQLSGRRDVTQKRPHRLVQPPA